MKRRDLLKTLGLVTGGAAAVACPARAEAPRRGNDDPVGVLVDTTRCIGCRMCEFACAEANGLPEPDPAIEPNPARETSPTQWTVVKGYQVGDRKVTVKRQCMHCLQPACVSGCLTRAMTRAPDGPVTWNAGRCMGCRFCMLSCPYDMPRFEYHSANPRIRKCQLCAARVAEGKRPACVEACPAQALTFGRRGNLLDEARSRIYTNPGRYVHHIYGEQEAGGSAWLYLSGVPFDQIGFRTDIANESYPGLTRSFLYAVPQVDVLAPLFMMGLVSAARAKERKDGEGGDK